MKGLLRLALIAGIAMSALSFDADSYAFAAPQEARAKDRKQRKQTEVVWEGKSFRDVKYKQVGKKKLLLDVYLPKGHDPEKPSAGTTAPPELPFDPRDMRFEFALLCPSYKEKADYFHRPRTAGQVIR